jgi:hypothetical protein
VKDRAWDHVLKVVHAVIEVAASEAEVAVAEVSEVR